MKKTHALNLLCKFKLIYILFYSVLSKGIEKAVGPTGILAIPIRAIICVPNNIHTIKTADRYRIQ